MSSFSWPHAVSIPVRFRDLDPMGHVNNAVYLTWFEEARTHCWLALTGCADPLESGRGLDFVVARAEIDYLAAARHGDDVTVEVAPASVGRTSFALAYVARRSDAIELVRGRTVQVCFDHAAGRKKPLSPAVADALSAGLPR